MKTNFFKLALALVLIAPAAAIAESGCGATIAGGIQCQPEQKQSMTNVVEVDVTTCICANACLKTPPGHYYLDDPVNKTKQANENEVTLPVVLAWDHIALWQLENGQYHWEWDGRQGNQAATSKAYGARSYLLEIENKNGELNDDESKGGIFRRILTTNEFNARDLYYPCFYNSDKTIRWRVRPCCKENGSYCQPEENATWWTFRTSPAPEPINFDDPDWNGPAGAKNISYKNLRLDWCHAQVSKEKQPYNENEPYSLSYQMRVYTNENQLVLTGAQIPAKFSDLANWLKKDTPALKNPLACHYLEKQTNNTCKADVVNPIKAKTPRNVKCLANNPAIDCYWWSHLQLPNTDRALFTKNNTYYWQLRRCFNNTNAGDENCNTQSDKYWGQLWTFTDKNETVPAPALLSPGNDNNYADSQTANLTEMPGRLQWQAPNGANSYGYDIQKISGGAGASLVNGERRVTTSQVLFAKGNANNSKSEEQNIELELDTAYKWRAKSCWPAIPVGEVCNEPWSDWWYFRTTGRAPKTTSMQPANNAKDLAMLVDLQWESVPGAKSYILDFNGQKITTGNNQHTLDYPAIDQKQSYKWKVQTCADANATLCGPAGPEFTFTTAALGASKTPANASSTLDNSQIAYNLSWQPVAGAHYYKVALEYKEVSEKETNKDCAPGPKVEKIVKDTSIMVDNDINQMFCLGKYQWSVLACLDAQCKDAGATPEIWSFDFVAGGQEIKKGQAVMAVCGMTNDNPNTEWDDREKCGAKHLLLNAMQIINLFLFQMSFWLLPILGLATAGIFFTNFSTPDLKQKVISWWKLIGIGYGLLFFAWLIVGVFLSLFGYSGTWWQI